MMCSLLHGAVVWVAALGVIGHGFEFPDIISTKTSNFGWPIGERRDGLPAYPQTLPSKILRKIE